MQDSENAMSAILLCSHIGLKKDTELKPLSLKEWDSFQEGMRENGLEPGAVLSHTFDKERGDPASLEIKKRIEALLSRAAAVAAELEGLEERGIDVVTIFDPGYPVLLKKRLNKKAPPVLFYAGNLDLAKKNGIAVVGSRNVDQDGMEFTEKLVEKAIGEKMMIYSGGAKGVDSISEQTAVRNGGEVVSYIGDSLLARIRKSDTRNKLESGNLLLFTDVNPDLGFTVARAMNRNKYIYASSCGAFVVSSDNGKGGTWAGATEAMRNEWVRVYVWNHTAYEGNDKLIEKGAISFELSEKKLTDLLRQPKSAYVQMNLFDQPWDWKNS